MEDDVFLYCEENAGADVSALTVRFGSPEVVAEEFLGALDPIIFSREYRSKQRIAAFIGLLMLTVAFIIGCFALREFRIARKAADDQVIELVPYEGELPEISGSGYWVRTNNGKDISYWEFDYETNQWVNVPIPSE